MSSDDTKRRYVSPKRSAASEETDARIVAAAFTVLGRVAEGGEAFSLETVAKQAGVTRLTVHNRFGSRRGLLEAVFDARAREAGLHRVARAMAMADAERAILAIVGIFCDFWSSDHHGLSGLFASGAGEPEFRQAMHERNERRRQIFDVLTARLVGEGRLDADRKDDVTDVLFALTGMPFFVSLSVRERPIDGVKALISGLARAAIASGQTQ